MSEVGLDIQTIYKYDTHRNVPWNIVEYQPLKEYLDPRQIATQRTRKQGQAQSPRYVTRRGSFLDPTLKNLKDLPAPCTYNFLSEFDQSQNKKESKKHKIDFKLKKNSYLQQIQYLAKRFKSPGVAQYHLQHSEKHHSHKKKAKIDSKRFFYQDEEFLSTTVPGSGCYYPREEVAHVKKDRTNYSFWVDKHKKDNEKKRRRSLKETDPGTYRPVSASFSSFDKIKIDHERREKKLSKEKPKHGFGSSDAKFDYGRIKKSKEEMKPAPCNYNTLIQWKGKGQDAKKNNWVRCLSAAPTRSIYH